MPGKRLIMIGWDGAERTAVETWMQEGVLPHLAALRDRGAWGRIASLPGLGDDAAWGSFATGTGPSTHGRFHHRQIVPRTYRFDSFFRDRMTGKPFWSQLGAVGRRVAILDVPKSPLARDLDGMQIADWLPHGEDGSVPVSWPPALAAGLPDRFRPDPGFSCHRVRTGIPELAELCDRIRRNLAMRTALALDWLGQERWDLFLAVFAESHCIGHHCWHLQDPDHPLHDREAVRTLGNPVREIHLALDAALGAIVKRGDAEATVIVFSLLGMGPNHMGTWLADAVLQRLERGPRGSSRPATNWLRVFPRLLADRLPGAGASATARGGAGSPELSDRMAFVVDADASGTAIRLNLAGREPHGKVSRGDYEAHCRFLAESFMALTDPQSGRALVSEVVRVADRFPGPRAFAFADLLVLWHADSPIRGAASDAIGLVDGVAPRDRSGNHHPGGWFVAAGPAIARGEVDTVADIVDLAPTAGAILGVELADVEGVPIPALAGPARSQARGPA